MLRALLRDDIFEASLDQQACSRAKAKSGSEECHAFPWGMYSHYSWGQRVLVLAQITPSDTGENPRSPNFISTSEALLHAYIMSRYAYLSEILL